MQPQASAQKADGLKQNYRIFHPQSTVWVQNPFDFDVTFQVADERNVPYNYRIKALSRAELPGGSVATLGVKAIIDQLIQANKKDILSIWDMAVRAKYEKDVILRVREAPNKVSKENPSEIDLTVNDKSLPKEDKATDTTPEADFPGLDDFPGAQKTPVGPPALPASPEDTKVKAALDDTVGATLGALPAASVLPDASE